MSDEQKHAQVYLVARYVDSADGEEVYFVKMDFRYPVSRLVCDCGEFLKNGISADRTPQPAESGIVVVPECRHTQHAMKHLKGEQKEILINRPAPDEVINHKDVRVPYWWAERNVEQFILGDDNGDADGRPEV